MKFLVPDTSGVRQNPKTYFSADKTSSTFGNGTEIPLEGNLRDRTILALYVQRSTVVVETHSLLCFVAGRRFLYGLIVKR